MNNTTNYTDTDLPPKPSEHALGSIARVVFATIGTLMIIIGVPGNGLVITVIIQFIRKHRHPHDLFVANLAVSDSVNLGYWLTFTIIDLILGKYPVVNITHCKMNGMIISVSVTVGILSLLAISVNRYLHVCHLTLYKRLFSWPRTVVTCISIWIVPTLMIIPAVLDTDNNGFGYDAQTYACTFKMSLFSYMTIVAVLVTVAPMIVVGYCNFAVFRFWKSIRYALYGSRERRTRRVIYRWMKYQRKGSRKKLAVRVKEMTDKESHQCEDQEPNPTRGSSDKGSLGNITSMTSSKVLDKSRVSECLVHISAHEDMNIVNENNMGVIQTVLPSTAVGCYLQKGKKDEKVHDKDEEHHNFSQTNSVPEKCRKAHGIPPSKKCGQTTEGTTITATSVKTPGDLKLFSPYSTTTPKQPEKRLSIKTRNLKGRKPSAKEVAFMRALLVVFILACVTYLPFSIVMAIRLKVALPPEIKMTAVLAVLSSSSVNWIVYGVMNPSFRKAYKMCSGITMEPLISETKVESGPTIVTKELMPLETK